MATETKAELSPEEAKAKAAKGALRAMAKLKEAGIEVSDKEIARLEALVGSAAPAERKTLQLENILSKQQVKEIDNIVNSLTVIEGILNSERSVSIGTAIKFLDAFKSYATGTPKTASDLGVGTAIALKAYITDGVIVPTSAGSKEKFYVFSDDETKRVLNAIG